MARNHPPRNHSQRNPRRSRGRFNPRERRSKEWLGLKNKVFDFISEKDGKSESRENFDSYRVNSAAEAAVEYLPGLLTYFPELLEHIPWISLRGVSDPSVPLRLVRSQHLFGDNYLYMKREGLDFHTLPDNKARKLEFILGDALQRRRKKLVTFGFVGSSHCMATVKAAQQLGLKSEVCLIKGPLTRDGLQMVAAMRNLGAKVRLCSSWFGFGLAAAWAWFRSKFTRTEVIPPGGSDHRGVLGYVSAMVELKSHLEKGELPDLDYLFVAVGSGSTLAGLELGRQILGLSNLKIVGVQTSLDQGADPERLAQMANEAITHLNKSLKQSISFQLSPSSFTILKDYVYGGHGVTTPDLDRWMSRFLELEETELETVYTLKALYGATDFLKKNRISKKKVLFWNTSSPFRKGDLPLEFQYSRLPWRLRRWAKTQQAEGRLVELGGSGF